MASPYIEQSIVFVDVPLGPAPVQNKNASAPGTAMTPFHPGHHSAVCCENITACMLGQSMWLMNLTGVKRRYNPEGMGAYRTILCMQIYIVPAIISLGVLTSIFTCTVLLRTQLRKKFYSHFLVGVCVSSAVFLLTVLVNWMFKQGVPIFAVAGVCQMTIFCSHFFLFLTCWLSVTSAMLILFDLTRLKSVKWMNSPGAAKVWVIGLTLLAFTIYSYKTWTHGVHRYKSRDVCTVIPENQPAMEVLNFIDMLLLLYLPSFGFLMFDVSLISWMCSRTFKTHNDVYRRRHAEVLKIVLCYSVCFHLLVTPKAISTSIVTFNRWVHRQPPDPSDLKIHQLLQILFYFFFAINPIFPFCVSRKFRRNASVLFSHGCSKNITMRQLRPVSPTL